MSLFFPTISFYFWNHADVLERILFGILKQMKSDSTVWLFILKKRASVRVSFQSLCSHLACLYRGFHFYEVKNVPIHNEKGNTFEFLIIFIVKSLQKSKIAQIYYYDPQSAGINLQSPQSDSTPWTLTLRHTLSYTILGIFFSFFARHDLKNRYGMGEFS